MLLGLTGGIATGKSTFGRMLAAKHPFVTFDADACVHEMLTQDSRIAEAIRDAFGPAAFHPDGTIDRPALRGIVFRDAGRRRALEGILHPPVRKRWEALRAACLRDGRDMLADIPLLFETGVDASFETTILVAASRQVQESRLAERGLDNATARAMLESQWPISKKILFATHVIWNDGSKEALEDQAGLLIESMTQV